MAEFLVHGALPIELVHELGVYDDRVRARAEDLVQAAALTIPVIVRRDWYF